MTPRWKPSTNRPVIAAALIAALLTALAVVFGRVYLRQKNLQEEAQSQATRAEAAARAARAETNKGERAREQAQDLVRFIMRDLSEALVPLGQAELLESLSRETLAYFDNLPPDLVTTSTEEQKAGVWLDLGHARYRLGDLKGAIEADRQAIALLEKLAKQEPDQRERQAALNKARLDSAHVFTAAGRHEDARALFRAALAASGDAAFLAEAEGGLGELEGIAGHYDTALRHFAKAVRHAENHLEKFPGNIGARKILTITHGNAGLFASRMGNQELAENSYREALASARRLVALDPDNRNWDKELATLLNNFGTMLELEGRIDEAADFFSEALDLRQSLVEWDPNNTRWLLNLANSWHNDAAIHYHRGNADGTLASSRQSLAIFQRLLTLQPRNTAWLEELLESFEIQKERLLELEAPEAALTLGEEVTAFVDQLKSGNPEDFAMTRALAGLYRQVGRLSEPDSASRLERYRLAAQTFAAEVDGSDEEALVLLAQSYLDLAPHCPEPAPVFALTHQLLTELIASDSQRLQRLRHFAWRETLVALGQVRALVPAGSRWSYYDDRQAPPRDWFQPAFDDTTWKSGPAPLGYGDGEEATTLDFGKDPRDKRITAWFRHPFKLEEVPAAIFLNLRRDDSARVFLNGREVLRSGLPEGDITPETVARNVAMGFDEVVFHRHHLTEHHLVPGRNVLAVEVHQNEPQSSDLCLDLEILDPTTLPDFQILLVRNKLETLLGPNALPALLHPLLKKEPD